MKIISILGGGGKALEYFIFGPEYTFPLNCYSETLVAHPHIVAAMATAHGMVGKAEPLLWPAERVRSAVGIIFPRSSEYWDLRGIEDPEAIMDCTNSNMDSGTTDYFSEVHGIYSALALQENVPVDFIDEDGLLDPEELAKFHVLFLTEPNLPAKGAAALLVWVKAGGRLVTTSNAAHWDEYDEPLPELHAGLGTVEAPRNRTVFGPTKFSYETSGAAAFQTRGKAADCDEAGLECAFEAWGATSKTTSGAPLSGNVLATFADGSPATVSTAVGHGTSVHFYWLPGVSHSAGGGGVETGENRTESRGTIGRLLANMTRASAPPVTASEPWIETPLLTGKDGAVVTLLNWGGQGAIAMLDLNVTLDFVPSRVESVVHGPTVATKNGEESGLTLSLPLDSADFLLFHR
jgi:hypothetical protein